MALDNKHIKLRAAAMKAGIPNYGSMSRAELQEALDNVGTKPASKRKSTSKSGSKRKSAAAVATKPKRKASGRKQTRKATVGRDSKRDNSPSVTKPKRGRPKGSTNKRKSAATSASSNGDAGRNLIDREAIDWSAEWTGGKTGNRAIIFKALRKYKGNYAKVLKALLPNVAKMYPKSSKTGQRYNKAEQVAMLKWHIGRTAFDFVTGTGQHEKATNRKSDKRTAGSTRRSASKSARKSATAVSDNGDVSDYSDQKLRKIVKAAEGRRGRKSALVHAAMSELEKRAGSKAKGKPKSAGSKRQKAAGGRKKASRQKVKA